ncbi:MULTISPECIES: type II secretion system protein J [unclassified Cryobacterium]|uniref:PulJ/GspJ family protein n=1 Tax=unclassified Cryobacterium TaxID=2649013 RepID=UPI00141B0AB8|nr:MULTISPECIES: prepilin-type N-terminal cleavage/methylation domain-containing protein [unclassified Cryobacterium]
MSRYSKPGEPADNGFTLIELLVYMSLATIVLFIVGGFLIDSLKVERDVSQAAEATTTAQLISTSVQSAVRNGSAVGLVNAGSDGSQMLITRTTTRGSTLSWVCQAWYYSASNKAIYTKTSATPAVAIALPASAPAGTWTLLGSGIGPSQSGVSVFSSTADSATLSFEVAAGTRSPVRVETKTYTRVKPPVSAPCFS